MSRPSQLQQDRLLCCCRSPRTSGWPTIGDTLSFQRRVGSGFAAGFWSVPAGHLESGETLHETCAREAREEIGVQLRPHALAFGCVQQKRDSTGQERLDIFFEATLPGGPAGRQARSI